MEIVGKLIVGSGLFIVGILARGITFSYLWKWFVVPFGIPAIGIAWSLGLSGILFFSTCNPYVATKEQSAWETLATAIIFPLLTLFMAYIYTLFM